MTEITLAICMYNAENYIEETLACILAQTMQDFRISPLQRKVLTH